MRYTGLSFCLYDSTRAARESAARTVVCEPLAIEEQFLNNQPVAIEQEKRPLVFQFEGEPAKQQADRPEEPEERDEAEQRGGIIIPIREQAPTNIHGGEEQYNPFHKMAKQPSPDADFPPPGIYSTSRSSAASTTLIWLPAGIAGRVFDSLSELATASLLHRPPNPQYDILASLPAATIRGCRMDIRLGRHRRPVRD